MKRLLIAALFCTGTMYADESKEVISTDVNAKHCSYHAKQRSEAKKAKKAKKKADKAKRKAYKQAKKDKKKAHKQSLRNLKKQRKADKKKQKHVATYTDLPSNPRAPRGEQLFVA